MALYAELDAEIPREVATGAGTALFVCGTAYSSSGPIDQLELALEDERFAVAARGMPRLDPYLLTGDPAAYRSGFWGFVMLAPPSGPQETAETPLRLHARSTGGTSATTELARIVVRRNLPSPAVPPACGHGGTGPLVAICMATHQPPPELLRAQLDSIRAQTHENWICLISDDCSSPAARAMIETEIRDDPRFALSSSTERLGFYRNFERALAMVPPEAQFVALADQDDRWHPGKLTSLLEAIGDAELVYSDARIVSEAGEEISPTYWATRRNNHSDLLSLLVANCVSGSACMIRSGLLDDALPFPPNQFAHYHDHWLALCARARGEIRYFDRALYDYVQHGRASLGHERANQMRTIGERIAGLRTRGPRERIRKWRMHYFVDIARLQQVALVLLARMGPRLRRSDRRTLERLVRAEHSPALTVKLLARATRELTGTPETLGGEWMLLFALAWRGLLSATAGSGPRGRLRIDALPPPDLAPGMAHGGGAAATARALSAKVEPLALNVSPSAPKRINLLIPSIDLEHFFGGYIGKFNLALRLARRGNRVRIVTVDPAPAPPADWAQKVAGYAGLEDFAREVEVAFGRERALEVNPADRFIATTWWTAHIAGGLARKLESGGFLYLIQEYEPFTFPMGSYAALAAESYTLPHAALFSTELLRDWFRERRIGVFAQGVATGDRNSASFHNAITDLAPRSREELAARATRRLLFYARPEPHAARNLFELGVLALERAAAAGAFDEGWELSGIGAVGGESQIALGHGLTLTIRTRTDQAGYARLLGEHDVGLALMYTPHPSLVPLEMASAGMLTVTNTYETKTREALRAISPNLLAAEPTVGSIASALIDATARVGQIDSRIAASAFDWPRDWGESFDERVLAFVEGWLAAS